MIVVAILFALYLVLRLEKLMSAISDFNAEMRGIFAAMSASLEGLTGDIATLNLKIADLTGSPEDAVMLAELKAIAGAMAERIEALNALTPPSIPSDTDPEQ